MSTPETTDTAGRAPRAWLHRFVRRLLEAREARGWTQDDLGKRTGLKATAISHFESGRRTPCMGNLIRLCRALNVSADHLLGLTKDENVAIGKDHPRCTCGRAVMAGELAKGRCYCGVTLKTNVKCLASADENLTDHEK
jgi:transcriptional regulator with XRE-family HTH domain